MGGRYHLARPAITGPTCHHRPEAEDSLPLDLPDEYAHLTREQLRELVRKQLEGWDLVAELLADRRREAEREDAETDAFVEAQAGPGGSSS